MLYLVVIVAALCGLYAAVFLATPVFFGGERVPTTRMSLLSVAYILVFACIVIGISVIIPDLELGNRFLHAVGGGCAAFLACFLGVRDSKYPISRLQFFVLSFLLVLSLGVANEIAEFILQNYFGFIAALTINDTWLDLISNTLGALFAGACLTPLLKNR